jgi:hypothetical protein
MWNGSSVLNSVWAGIVAHRWLRLAAPVLWALCVTAGLSVLFQHWSYDDPYITYRYADNLARGWGLVFNHGERTLSTTTPLFALVLTLARLQDLEPRQFAVLLGSASMAAGSLALFTLGVKWQRPLLAWALLLIYPFSGLILLTLSSETPLFLALCLAAIAAYEHERYAASGALVALAFLTRGDGALLGFVLALDYLVRFRLHASVRRAPVPWRALLLAAAIVGLWLAWAGWYFGNPLPVTLAAKRAQGLMEISQSFAAGLVTVLPKYLQGVVAMSELVLAGVGLAWSVVRVRRSWLVIAWVLHTRAPMLPWA